MDSLEQEKRTASLSFLSLSLSQWVGRKCHQIFIIGLVYRLPLPLGEGWGEGYCCDAIYEDALILTFSQREKGRA